MHRVPSTSTGAAQLAVSVIMIFLDAGRLIEEAIESLIQQTCTDWELILVDDGSSDGSTESARRFVEQYPERLRYIDHPHHENLGMSASRNAGLRHARGEFVAFLDADDVYLPERLERHLRLFRDHPEVAMVQSCMIFWRSWSNDPGAEPDTRDFPPPVPLQRAVQPGALLLLLLQSRGSTVPGICSVTVRRSVLVELGGFVDAFRSTYEDQVLLAKMYLHAPVWIADECLAKYRQHAKSNLQLAKATADYAPGRPHAAQDRYLCWLEDYLRAQGNSDKFLWASLRRASWPYRHPWLARIRNAPQAALARVRWCAERVLPAEWAEQLVRWYGSRKLIAATNRARKAGARIADRMNNAVDAPEVQIPTSAGRPCTDDKHGGQ